MAGGYRPGSGAKRNQHRIASGELRKALEEKLGMPYTQMLAETQLKLFQDFKNDINVRDYIRFTENMSDRILVNQENEIVISDVSELSKEDIDNRINNLLARKALSEPNAETDQSQE